MSRGRRQPVGPSPPFQEWTEEGLRHTGRAAGALSPRKTGWENRTCLRARPSSRPPPKVQDPRAAVSSEFFPVSSAGMRGPRASLCGHQRSLVTATGTGVLLRTEGLFTRHHSHGSGGSCELCLQRKGVWPCPRPGASPGGRWVRQGSCPPSARSGLARPFETSVVSGHVAVTFTWNRWPARWCLGGSK